MRILILLVLFGLSLAELTTYNEFKIYALEHHIKNVEEYAVSLGLKDFLQQFEKFKIEFDKHYTKEEDEMRQFYFLKTLLYIEQHNNRFKNGDVTHDVGLNHLADWTPEELKAILNVERHEFNETQTREATDPTLYANLPASFDWRQRNKVTPVKNQGQCGACWAFATVATIESAQAIKHNQMVSLSEQQLVDCVVGAKYNNGGCKGGWAYNAYHYVIDNGLEMNADYPYKTQQLACHNEPQKSHLKISGYKQLPVQSKDEEIMAAIMNNGPVAVDIDASGNDFGLYRSGIITTGNRNRNHYVTAIGWGSENGINYWIVKNSWGTGWGQGGFGKMQRGVNIRSFNQNIFYPIIN